MGAGASMYDQVHDEAQYTISVQKLNELLETQTDVFVTHDWGKDQQTHINMSVWSITKEAPKVFDEERMQVKELIQIWHSQTFA